MSLLRVERLSAAYGSAQALFDVTLTVARGEVTVLLGPNGVGKSTTIRAICRLLPFHGGRLYFDGHDLAALPCHRAARLGIGLVPEGRRCFQNLTVEQNLRVAARPGPWGFARVAALFPRLAERRTQTASTLSGGEQQMLAIGRALMTNPKLLILDEATEGLAPLIRQEIWTALANLKSEGQLAILLVDKSLRDLRQVADQALILARGANLWSGPMAQLSADVRAQYLDFAP